MSWLFRGLMCVSLGYTPGYLYAYFRYLQVKRAGPHRVDHERCIETASKEYPQALPQVQALQPRVAKGLREMPSSLQSVAMQEVGSWSQLRHVDSYRR